MNDAIPRPQAKVRKALTPLLEIRNLTKSFDGQHAVDDVSLTIYKGEIFALLGASGCGKSTLLRMLAGFEQPTAGQIVLDGVDLSSVPPYQRPINMMFQSYALFPHMTVFENVAFGLRMQKTPASEIPPRVTEALRMVQLEAFAQRKPHQLSGGQQQQLVMARALAGKPKLLLLDEPTEGIQPSIIKEMAKILRKIRDAEGLTILVSEQVLSFVLDVSDKIVVIEKGNIVHQQARSGADEEQIASYLSV